MKNYLFLFIIFFANYSIFLGQTNSNPYIPQIDSVQKLLNTQTKEDTAKVRRLYDLAFLCFYDLQYERGLIAANQARQLSKSLNYPKGEGLYLNTILFFPLGNISFYYYLEKIWFYDAISEKEETNKLMEIRTGKKDLKKENGQLFVALGYFEKVQDKETVAKILAAISANYQQLENNNESLVYTDRAIRLFNEIGQRVPASYLLLAKITMLEKMGKLTEAREAEI